MTMKILDATAGSRSIWYQPKHPLVTFMDKRRECYKDPRHDRYFVHRIEPDVVSEWKDCPFPDNHFDMVVFDPPHLIRKKGTKEIHLVKKYGELYEEDYKQVISEGLQELFRVLKPNGVFILKWAECSKKVDEILKLFPYPPLFGTRTGQKNNNHWIVFLKYDVNMKLDELIR